MGNTQSRKFQEAEETLQTDNPYLQVPTSPQSPMPYPHIRRTGTTDVGVDQNSAFDIAWPQPKLFHIIINWQYGGNQVFVEGSFDDWKKKFEMQKNGTDFTIVKILPPGVYQYKFIVDGQYRYDPHQPAVYDEQGNINNVIEVQEYAPDIIDNPSFEPPMSPIESYDCPEVKEQDFQKETPQLPQHMGLTVLNVPQGLQQTLPRPLHVILNHIYIETKSHTKINALVLGTTTRYKSKYITTVMYKPWRVTSVKQQQQQPDNNNSRYNSQQQGPYNIPEQSSQGQDMMQQ